MAGELVTRAVRAHGATLLPIDSEHNAIFQCLPNESATGAENSLASRGVRKIVLTASGGPFRSRSLEALGQVTPEEASAHPNWSMGKKLWVESPPMMTKGSELI